MKKMPSSIIDLIYIDPPFFSQKDRVEFNDKWENVYSYISFLEPRVKEMYRLLKKTGSFYLHCDQSASHYIKIMLDAIFGMERFINEIAWCYRGGGRGRTFARKHDTIFFYSKGDVYTFNDEFARVPYSESFGGGAFYYSNMKGKMPRKLEKGIHLWSPDERGKVLEDYWMDIPVLGSQSYERTGYPTQKPESLLERIIKVSSNPGDLVADFFCGSGTTLVVSKKNGRHYLGCDSNEKAIEISKKRLDECMITVEL